MDRGAKERSPRRRAADPRVDALDLYEEYVLHEESLQVATILAGRQWEWEPKHWLPARPVFFASGNNAPNGVKAPALQDAADSNWERAGFGFQWRQPIVLSPTNGGSPPSPEFSQTSTCIPQMINTLGVTNFYFNPVDADAVEVFFCSQFSSVLENLAGGGLMVARGEADAMIVMSDEIDIGSNALVLGHELGHALRLQHPSGYPDAGPDSGSTGTVMCGAVFNTVDHPDTQSERNAEIANNPLLVGSLIPTGGPSFQCSNDLDCGACP